MWNPSLFLRDKKPPIASLAVDNDDSPWLLLQEPQATTDPDATRFSSRIESIGVKLPAKRLSTHELLAKAAHHPHIELERLTGIHARHVCEPGEDSFTLAVGAARDCLSRSEHASGDIEMLISCSISKFKDGLSTRWEPPLSLSIKDAIGASGATSFDLSNACAGMMTGVFVLNDFIRRGVIRCGMVVSGEYISNLGANAAKEVRTILSKQLASLTLGDAGSAVIVERAPYGDPGIVFAGFTTLAEHSRLCRGYPSKVGPGATMYTEARKIHRVAIEDAPPLVCEALEHADLHMSDIDYVIPHQTSARAIRKGAKEMGKRLGEAPGHVVSNVEEYGNTASTSHFIALDRYLRAGRLKADDRLLLLSLASGLEVGVMIFSPGDLVNGYACSS